MVKEIKKDPFFLAQCASTCSTRPDVIVNTANPHVAVGKGVDSAIYNAAGFEKLLNARREIGGLIAGEVGNRSFCTDKIWIFTIIFICGFALIWLAIYIPIRMKVNRMNRMLNQ